MTEQTNKMSVMRSGYYVLSPPVNQDNNALMWSRYYDLSRNRGEQAQNALMWSRILVLSHDRDEQAEERPSQGQIYVLPTLEANRAECPSCGQDIMSLKPKDAYSLKRKMSLVTVLDLSPIMH